MKTAASLGLIALIALSASACGRMGDLEPPRQTERAPRGDHSEPLPDPATQNIPPSQNPIDGAPRSPF